jgi:hypothetical protein
MHDFGEQRTQWSSTNTRRMEDFIVKGASIEELNQDKSRPEKIFIAMVVFICLGSKFEQLPLL